MLLYERSATIAQPLTGVTVGCGELSISQFSYNQDTGALFFEDIQFVQLQAGLDFSVEQDINFQLQTGLDLSVGQDIVGQDITLDITL